MRKKAKSIASRIPGEEGLEEKDSDVSVLLSALREIEQTPYKGCQDCTDLSVVAHVALASWEKGSQKE